MSTTSVLQDPQRTQSVPTSTPVAALVSVVAGENKVGENVAKQTGAGGGVAVSVSPPVAHNLQTHYEELLRVIAEVGKDVKPAYTNSKISSDRLKRNIALARSTLRDCLLDIERLNHTHSLK